MTTSNKTNERSGSPRIADIAERCGVSGATVCRALRGKGRQSRETIDRIVSIAREMGYDPAQSHAARQLALQRFGQRALNNTLGLFFVRTTHSLTNYGVKMLRGAIEASGDTEFEFYTSDSYRVELCLNLPVAYRRGDIDGILTFSQHDGWANTYGLLRADPGFGDRPIVGIVEHLDGCSGVYADHHGTGRATIGHLLDLGHSHVLHFERSAASATDVHVMRFAAYVRECQERGLDRETCLHFHNWTFAPDELESNKRLLIEHLRHHPEITAIIAQNDMHAGEIFDALVNAGYRVPQDISLVSSDDTDPIVDGNRENILTTVRLPLEEIGREGTKLLIRRILGEETKDRDIVMPVELIVRGSTAPPRKQKG